MEDANLEASQINQTQEDHTIGSIMNFLWYSNIIYYMRNMKGHDNWRKSKKIIVKLHVAKYVLIEGDLYWKNRDGILHFCLDTY